MSSNFRQPTRKKYKTIYHVCHKLNITDIFNRPPKKCGTWFQMFDAVVARWRCQGDTPIVFWGWMTTTDDVGVFLLGYM